MRTKLHTLLLTCSLCMALIAVGDLYAQPAYKNAALPVDTRVKDLLYRMTNEEKFYQLFMIPGEINKGMEHRFRKGLFGFQVSAASSDGGASQQLLSYNTQQSALALASKINEIQRFFIEESRLGIPMLPFDEALHGLVREGATAFPQSIALAASWDTVLMRKVASAIAHETRIRGIRQILSPVINIATDVRWGRTEETYGEDPFLVSAMGIAFMQPFEKNGIITTPKHFIANTGDGGRDSYPIQLSEWAMSQIHYPPFIKAFQKAGAKSVMTSYNSVNGSPATANKHLLTHVLKKSWNFKGFVISDASAVGGANVLHYTASDYADAGKKAIENGLDVIFQTSIDHDTLFLPPFLDGSIDSNRVNDAVARVLKAKFESKLFDQPYVDVAAAADTSYLATHRELAGIAAKASIVLLKNRDATLPITKPNSKIVVIGTDAVEARLGGYSGPGNNKVNILDGLRNRLGNNQVLYAPGPGRTWEHHTPVPASALYNAATGTQQGLIARYFNNIALQGIPTLTRTDGGINFHWTFMGPDPKVSHEFYSVEWNGFIEAPETGWVAIGLKGNDGYRMYLDDQLVIDRWSKQSHHTDLVNHYFKKGVRYPIRIQFHEAVGNGELRLVWNQGMANNREERIAAAVEAATHADLAIIVAGIEEGEFRDRASLALPGELEALIKRVSAKARKTIVVLIGGSAITMPWIEDVDAIVYAWYPGEQGGKALTAVLLGDYNPAGRLPITFPLSEAQLPLVYNPLPTGRGNDYLNLSGQPLFPFGYGLSYTNFTYSHLQLEKDRIHAGDSIRITCTIQNTGSRDGDEVVQLYLRDQLSSLARPVMELKGFQRIHLQAGEERKVHFTLMPEHMEMLNENLETIIEPGHFRVMIGASSRDIRLNGRFTVQ